jgi:hypothetical protein
MKSTDPDKDELLDSLMGELEHDSAPSIDRVLGNVRREKNVRANRLLLAGTLAVVALTALLFSQRPAENFQPLIAVAAKAVPNPPAGNEEPVGDGQPETESEPWKVDRIDDRQLLEMLGEAPVALVRYPDGNRRLMMVVDNSGQ